MRLNIDDFKDLAEKKGGKCHSSDYVNAREKMIWECENGHYWKANAIEIKMINAWCPKCKD